MADNTFTRLQQVIVDHLEIPADKIVPTAHLAKDLGLDSLDAMDLLMAIDETFQVRIPPEKMEAVDTVSALVALIEEAAA